MAFFSPSPPILNVARFLALSFRVIGSVALSASRFVLRSASEVVFRRGDDLCPTAGCDIVTDLPALFSGVSLLYEAPMSNKY